MAGATAGYYRHHAFTTLASSDGSAACRRAPRLGHLPPLYIGEPMDDHRHAADPIRWLVCGAGAVDPGHTPAWFGLLLLSWGHALLLALPVVLLAVFTRAPRFRAIYRTEALAVVFVWLLGLVRIFPRNWTQGATLGQILLCLLATWTLRCLSRQHVERRHSPAHGVVQGLSLGLVVAVPWLLWGALGSPLDTV